MRIRLEPPLHRHAFDGRLDRYLEPAVLQPELQRRIADVAGQAQPLRDAKLQRRIEFAERAQVDPRIRKAAIEGCEIGRLVLFVLSEEGTQVERLHAERAGQLRPRAARVELQPAGHHRAAERSRQAIDAHDAGPELRDAGQAGGSGVGQGHADHFAELRKIGGAKAEANLAVGAADATLRGQPAAGEIERQRYRPAGLTAEQRAQLPAFDRQFIGHRALDLAARAQLHAGADRQCSVEPFEPEFMRLRAAALIGDGDVVKVDVADIDAGRVFHAEAVAGRRRRRRFAGSEGPVGASVVTLPQVEPHRARRQPVGAPLPAQQRQQVEPHLGRADAQKIAATITFRLRDAQLAHQQLRSQADAQLQRAVDADLAADLRGQHARQRAALRAEIQRNAGKCSPAGRDNGGQQDEQQRARNATAQRTAMHFR